MRRVLRAVLAVVVGLVLAVTLASVAIDLSPVGAARPASELYAGPFVRVGSTLVAYRRWGGGGSPIVLLGGAAEPSWVWHDVGPRLAAAGHRVFALDLPPFGYTQRNVPPTMAGWLSLLRGFERKLGIVRPELVGHSLGAGVAVEEAIQRPAAVAKVVLLDGDALAFGGRAGWVSHVLVYPWFDAAFRVFTGWDWLVGRILRNAWGPGAPTFPHATLAQFERPFRVAGTEGEVRTMMAHGIPGVRIGDLARVRTPRAVVWGANDTVDDVSSGRRTAAALGVPLQLVPGAGHLSMLSRPAAVARLVLARRAAPTPPVPRLRHVVVVVFENHEASQVAGSSEAPHFALYARRYARLTSYTAVAHPSLPNYLALVSGSTHGITSDCTSCAVSGPSIGTLLGRRGLSWGGYAQGYPSSPRFAKKHMPFLYFADGAPHVHPLSALSPQRLPAFALVAPDLCNDAHDCSLGTADAFLARFLPPLLHVPRTAVYVVFDEGTSDAGGGGRVFAFVAGTAVRPHSRSDVPLDHYGLLRTVEEQLGVSALGLSATEAPIAGIWRGG